LVISLAFTAFLDAPLCEVVPQDRVDAAIRFIANDPPPGRCAGVRVRRNGPFHGGDE